LDLTVHSPGQPSTAFVDGQFYMVYTDTTGYGSNPIDYAGAYVLRCADPAFQAGAEELGADGFAPVSQAQHTAFPLVQVGLVSSLPVQKRNAIHECFHHRNEWDALGPIWHEE
jgi:hypothetical protein